MPTDKAPCKDCEDRHRGCHDSCSRYAEFRQTIEAIHERKLKITKPTRAAMDFRAEMVLRARKAHRGGNRR